MAERCPSIFTSATCDWNFWPSAIAKYRKEWYEEIGADSKFLGWCHKDDERPVTYAEFRDWAKSIY